MSDNKAIFTTAGNRLTRSMVQRGLWLNIIAGSLGMVWVAVAMGIPMTMFMECLGASGVMIGMIVTIQQVTTIVQIPAALAGEQMRSRKLPWMITVILHRALWIIPALLPFIMAPRSSMGPWLVLATVAVSWGLAQAAAPLWFSWMADLVPDQNRGRFWGVRQSITVAAHLLGMWGAGWLLDYFPDPRNEGGSFIGFSIVFAIAAAMGVLDIVVHGLVPEPRVQPQGKHERLRSRLLAPLQHRDFRWLTLAFGVWFFALGLTGSFGILYLTRTFNVSYTHLSVIMISASLGTVVSGLLWGKLMDLIGVRAFGAVMLILAPLAGAGWFFFQKISVTVFLPFMGSVTMPQPIAILLVVNFIAGALFSGVGLSQLNLLGALAPEKGRTMAMAVHWTIVGGIGALGPLLGGVITDWWSLHPSTILLPGGQALGFIHVLILIQAGIAWMLALPCMLKIKPREQELAIPFLVGNPLRAASTVYGMMRLSGAASRHERVQAVRRLGKKSEKIPISELAAKLEDPSSDVREEAAYALGRIGTDEAVGVLIQKMDDPNVDLGPQIARALRLSRHPHSVDTLIKKLVDQDRETLTESVKALGAIGDPKAAPSLLEILQNSQDDKVLSASSEALARIGEMAAIYDIIPRLKSTHNPILKRSLAMAIGDLLGEHDQFYAIFIKEEANRGDEVSLLLKTVRRRFKRACKNEDHSKEIWLQDKLQALENAYEDQNLTQASTLLLEIAVVLASFKFNLSPAGTMQTMTDELLWRNSHIGCGFWYIHLLSEEWEAEKWGSRDWTDILLGIYVLSTWTLS